MYDHGFGCEEKHLEDMELSEEFFEKMDELIAEESKKYIKDQIEYFKESSKFKDAKNEEITKKYEDEKEKYSELKKEQENSNLLLTEKDKTIDELKAKIKAMDNKFLVGETCFYIDSKRTEDICPECKGNRMVKGIYKDIETDLPCPICTGNGKLKGYWKYYADEKEIKAIQFDNNGIEYAVTKWDSDWHFENKDKFFKTLEEAETECEKLNKKEKEGE